MSTFTVDTNDDINVLEAYRNLLTELIGEPQPADTAGSLTKEQRVGAEPTPRKEGGGTSTTPFADAAADGPDDTGAGHEVDALGVAFNTEFCGKAKDPFYGSGKRKGQWKKLRGVTDEQYDAWYIVQLEPGAAQETADQVDTSTAFGAAPAAEVTPAPTDCGSFMGWVSAKQAAGLLTQDDIGNAYTLAGVQVTDLFPPNDPATVEKHVTALYMALVAKAGI